MEEEHMADPCAHSPIPAQASERVAIGSCSAGNATQTEDCSQPVTEDHSRSQDSGFNATLCKSTGCCGGGAAIEDGNENVKDLQSNVVRNVCDGTEKEQGIPEANTKICAAETLHGTSYCVDTKQNIEPQCGGDCCSAADAMHDDASDGDGCDADCCESPFKQTTEPLSQNICCDRKSSPCCNGRSLPESMEVFRANFPLEECLERAVHRECRVCSKGRSDLDKFRRDGKSESLVRDTHTCSIRESYEATLKSLGCLCRTLIAQGRKSCCVSTARSSIDRGVQSGRITKRSGTRSSLSSMVSVAGSSQCRSNCCEETKSTMRVDKNFPSTTDAKDKDMVNTAKEADLTDVEKGVMNDSEHVVLSISGMTCTGCEVKLHRTLAQMKHLHNIRTSLVLSRAEFDLHLGSIDVDDVIRRLTQATDFKVEHISTTGAELDVMPVGDIQQFLLQDLPPGVSQLKKVNKNVVRIYFDPMVIGARDLISGNMFNYPTELAPIRSDDSASAGRRHVMDLGIRTLLSAVLTIPVLVIAWAPITPHPVPYGATSLALATIIQFAVAGPFYPQAIKSLFLLGVVEMDLLIVLSTTAAYIFSVTAFGFLVAGQELSTGEFFETSTLLVTLIMVGRFMSALARQKAVESISLRSLQAPQALLVGKAGIADAEIDARLLQYGDSFRVTPDSRIPTDGTVTSGTSEADESMLTGECLPVSKTIGSLVVAGSINKTGTLTVQLTRLPDDNTITSISAMIDEAKLSKPKIQALADRVASVFVPVIIGLAVLVFLIWIAVGIAIRHYSASEAVINGITYGITVLIVSCPCAIGLAVPMVIVIASGVAVKQGFIFKSAEVIELACKITHVVFDKTGTLTQGNLAVRSEKYIDDTMDEGSVSSVLAGLVSDVKHPVSRAMATTLKDRGVVPVMVSDVTTVPGHGVEGIWNSKPVRVGSAYWLAQEQHPVVREFHAQGYTILVFQIGSSVSAVFGLQDTLRLSATAAVTALRTRGIKISLLSGDNEGAVANVAAKLDITEYRALCKPSDKQDYLRSITQRDPHAITLFVGDGTNDAPALTQATIGIHINEGKSDIATSAANAVLINPDLTGILRLISLSRAAVRRIIFNFMWSFVYNLLALLLASGALVAVRIPPQFGGLGELVSVLPVIAIAIQLRYANFAK